MVQNVQSERLARTRLGPVVQAKGKAAKWSRVCHCHALMSDPIVLEEFEVLDARHIMLCTGSSLVHI
jgi:hypothetical protein